MLDTTQQIAQGGTTGLIYALCAAVAALAAVVIYLAKYALTAQTKYATDMAALQTAQTTALTTLQTAHTTALTTLQSNHSAALSAIHEKHATETARIQEARIKEMADITEAANTLRETVERLDSRRGAK